MISTGRLFHIIFRKPRSWRHNYIFPASQFSFVFGEYDYSFRFESPEIVAGITKSGNFVVYERKSPDESVRKVIGSSAGKVIVNPVEPVNLPQEITRFLEIHFTPVVLAPESENQIYVKFPVEIAVFLESKGNYDVLDIFSLNRPKYALYGPPDQGVITRHFESEVFDDIPETDACREGVMELTIRNLTRGWIEVSRVVFENTGIYIYYGDCVSMVGQMDIFSKTNAETKTLACPLRQGMNPAIPLFTARKSLIPENLTFLMEFGVGE
jgi:Uncharacterized conserved protein